METSSSASAAVDDWALISMDDRLADGFRSAIPKAAAKAAAKAVAKAAADSVRIVEA